MRRLPKNFHRLQQVIMTLHECLTLAVFKKALPSALMSLAPFDFFYLMEMEIVPKTERKNTAPGLAVPWPEKSFLTRHSGCFPLASLATEKSMGAACPVALQLADFYVAPRHRAVEFFTRFPEMPDRRMATLFTAPAPHIVGAIGLSRWGRNFSDAERQILACIQPHVSQTRRLAGRNAEEPTAGSGERPGGRLTPREAEIAHWLVRGKANPEIALILAISARTIEKHMETILKKLGVENRAGAAAALAGLEPQKSGGESGLPPNRFSRPAYQQIGS